MATELVARNSDDGKALGAVLFVELLQAGVLLGVAALAGDVDEQDDLAFVLAQVDRLAVDVLHAKGQGRWSWLVGFFSESGGHNGHSDDTCEKFTGTEEGSGGHTVLLSKDGLGDSRDDLPDWTTMGQSLCNIIFEGQALGVEVPLFR